MTEGATDRDVAAGKPSRAHVLSTLGLCAAAFCAYLPILGADFVDHDDYPYVVEEPHIVRGLTWEGVTYLTLHRTHSNWHPVTTVSHMLDVELFGMDPRGHHLTSVLLHLLNGVLLSFGLRALTGRSAESLAVAALFLLHPLNVEPVAWVSQRKTVLAATFGLLTMAAYVRYVRGKSQKAYALSLSMFALSLMSKAMLVTMPALLLVLDAWPLARLGAGPWTPRALWPRARMLLLDKLPFAALSAGCTLIALRTQDAGGSLTSLEHFGVLQRACTIALAYASYVKYLVWPFDLAVLGGNPFMPESGAAQVSALHVAGAFAIVLALVAVGVVQVRRRPFVLAGVAYYLLSIVPVIGFVQLTDQLMADRYAYLTLPGIMLALVWLLGEALRALPPSPRRVLLAVGLPVLGLGLLARTADQQRHWQSSVALFERAAVYTPASAAVLMQVGRAHKHAGDIERSVLFYARSLRYDPTQEEALRHVAVAGAALSLAASGPERDRALDAYRRQIGRELPPGEGRYQLALALLARGAREEARYWLETLRAHAPRDARVLRALAAMP